MNNRSDEKEDTAPVAPAPPIDFGGPVVRPFRRMEEAALGVPPFALFEEVARAHPERVAVEDDGLTLTYGALHGLALRLAREVAGAAPRGTPVALALPNSALAPAALLAALATGRPSVMLDLDSPDFRLAEILEHAGATAVMVDGPRARDLARVAPHLRQIDVSAALAEDPAGVGAPELQEAPTQPGEVALIVYTSGSTGQPKGIAHRADFLVRAAQSHINGLHIAKTDRLLQLFAPAVLRSVQDTLGALLSGASLDVVDLKRQGLQEIARATGERGATIVNTLPQVLRSLLSLHHPPGTFASMRIVALGGDRVFGTDVALFRSAFPDTCLLYLHLGSSESDKYAHQFIGPQTSVPDGLLSAGHLVPGMDVRLDDEAGRPVPAGTPGRVILESRHLAHSYWRDPERTAAAFKDLGDGRVAFHIGDVARFDADGVLHYIGRDDRMVKVRGNRVDLTEVETAIRAHPGVTEAAVLPRRLPGDAAIIAFVVPRPGSGLDREGLAAHLMARLPPAMQPAEILLREHLPALPNLKLDLKALEREVEEMDLAPAEAGDEAPAASPAETAPSSPLEALVREGWTRLLPAATWDEERSWREAGGDSLKAMELVMRLERALGRPVPVSVLLPDFRPRDLMVALAEHLDNAAEAPRADGRPILWLLPGAAGPIMHQAAYARAVADKIDLRILDYPPIDPADPRVVPLGPTLDFVRAQIPDGDPETPLLLAGYSYGGYLAVELALRLMAEGRAVAFLGVIDSPPLPKSGGGGASVRAADAHLAEKFAEMDTSLGLGKRALNAIARAYMDGAYQLVRRGWLKPLSRAIGLVGQAGRESARDFLWWHVTHMARRASMLEHEPSAYPGRIFLFRVKDEPGRATPEDYAWGRYGAAVSVAYVDGLHDTVFAPQNVGSFDRALRAALAEAGVGPGSKSAP